MSINTTFAQMPPQAGNLQAHNNYADVNALDDLKRQARDDQRAALQPVAEQFEALFVQQVFKEARKVSFDDGWLDGNQGDFYKDWHDKQLAQNLSAKGTLGFADKIVEQLAPSIHTVAQSIDIENKALQKQQDAQPVATQTGVQLSSTQQAVALRQIK